MNSVWLAVLLFAFGNLLNIFYITVLYHRGLAHESVKLNRFSLWLVAKTGIWVTGIDPKAWVCMHRAHHMHSDTDEDPHSPVRFGVLGVATGQLRSYKKALVGLIKGNSRYTNLVSDIKLRYFRKLWMS